jgi:ABC-type polysaccharide/polyol phosphate export permease
MFEERKTMVFNTVMKLMLIVKKCMVYLVFGLPVARFYYKYITISCTDFDDRDALRSYI